MNDRSPNQSWLHLIAVFAAVSILCGTFPAMTWAQSRSGQRIEQTYSSRVGQVPRSAPSAQFQRRPGSGPILAVPQVNLGPIVTQPGVPAYNPYWQAGANQSVAIYEQRAPMMNPFPGIAPANSPIAAESVRIKDITTIEGHRTEVLTGMGLVYGLKNTGGASDATKVALRNLLQRHRQELAEAPAGSVALVRVRCEVSVFTRSGEKLIGSVGAIDNSSSLVGGILLPTPLYGINDEVYAMAQGELIVDGFSAGGAGATVAKNHDTTGSVDVTLEVPVSDREAYPDSTFNLLLRQDDDRTAVRIAAAINQYYPNCAKAIDPGCVTVRFPPQFMDYKPDFASLINQLRVVPDMAAKVIVDQKTGTVVFGRNVKISQAVIANENLIVTTAENPAISQPAPLSQGVTAAVDRTQLTATETGGNFNLLSQQPTVGDLANLLNQLGVRPRELIIILQQLRNGGHLQCELVIQ